MYPVDVTTGVITNNTKGKTYKATPFPAFMQEIINAEGLINYLKERTEVIMKKIAVIKGDGIGPEIVLGAIKVLDVISEKYNFPI